MVEMSNNPPISVDFFGDDLDDDEEYQLNNYIKDMQTVVYFRRPTSIGQLWVLWNDQPTLSPCGIADSVTHTPTTTTNLGIVEKIISALQHFSKGLIEDCVLIQFWAPITTETETEGGCYLVTSDKPFGLTILDERLLKYRKHCLDYKFHVNHEQHLGIPGCVFQRKSHQYTPHVQYYSTKEYPQRNFALTCDITASLVLPVFETSGQDCVGVLELVTNSHFTTLHTLCNWCLIEALKKVDLKGPTLWDLSSHRIDNGGYKDTLAEFREGLKVVCRTHKLSWAQTWFLCSNHNHTMASDGSLELSSNTFDVSCIGQVLHVEKAACYLGDNNLLGDFSHFCWGNDLQKGEGIVWRAYLSGKPCFCGDITQFNLTEYPLLPIARHFGLTGCFAISLQSTYTGKYDYVLEFFLHSNNTYGEDPSTFLCSLLKTMKQHFPSCKLSSGEELGEEVSIEIIKPRINWEPPLQCQSTLSPYRPGLILQNGRETMPPHSSHQQVDDDINNGRNVVDAEQSNIIVPYYSDKAITSEELRDHFGKKLEDVAKIYGVSRSKIKRICREREIKRWPHPKRNKANISFPRCLPAEKPMASVTHTTPLVTAMHDVQNMTIKATYANDIIKFELPFLSRKVDLEEEVSKRLKLDVGTYKIKYIDDEGDQILVACNEDLQHCMSASRSSNIKTTKMLVESISNESPLV